MMKPIPGSVSEITPDWLTDALRLSTAIGAARVTSMESTPTGSGQGVMSQVARLRLSYDVRVPGAPESLIVKLPPEDTGSRSVGVQLGFFEREARFYNELAEHTAIRVPRCYFSRYEPGDGAFLTLLEDLSDARPGDIGTGCSVDDGAAAIRVLAGLHASWWDSPVLPGLPWLQTRGEQLAFMLSVVDETWPTFVSRFGPSLGKGQMRALASVSELLSRSPNAFSSGPPTLLHGDFKLDNIFFARHGDAIAFDWGLVMTGPAAFDLAYFLGLNFEPPERRRYEMELIRTYLDSLAARGVNDYDFEKCVADYRLQLAGLLPQLIVAGGRATFADNEALQRYAGGLRRVVAAVSDHHVLDQLQRDTGNEPSPSH